MIRWDQRGEQFGKNQKKKSQFLKKNKASLTRFERATYALHLTDLKAIRRASLYPAELEGLRFSSKTLFMIFLSSFLTRSFLFFSFYKSIHLLHFLSPCLLLHLSHYFTYFLFDFLIDINYHYSCFFLLIYGGYSINYVTPHRCFYYYC